MFFRKAKRIAELEKEVERLSLENSYMKNSPTNFRSTPIKFETYRAVVNFPEEVEESIRNSCAKKKLVEELYPLMRVESQHSIIEGKYYTRASIDVVIKEDR